ncbi:hypothetical protein [Candidatus Poriferisodalis sp.]|uniref:hypothetical protein n=1 Tax=Candidatus Poriferisodalis sp. TaxID=3101277 RepID=UPI003B5D045B
MVVKRSVLVTARRRRRSRALLDMIASWEAVEGPIAQEHLESADAVLDRQGIGC